MIQICDQVLVLPERREPHRLERAERGFDERAGQRPYA
jgi:hypothetical protein